MKELETRQQVHEFRNNICNEIASDIEYNEECLNEITDCLFEYRHNLTDEDLVYCEYS